MTVDWAQVYAAIYDDLVRFLHLKVWDADRASDLAQEAFVRVLDKNPENPKAFVYTVALNLARDEARTAIRRRRHLELIKAEATGHTNHAETAELEERSAAVQRALGQHGAVIAVNAHEPGATDAEALAAHAASRIPAPDGADGADGAGEPGSAGGEAPAGVTNRPGVAVVVGLGTDGTVVAVCLGRPPDHGSARRRA